jgi:hypothetical protein
MSTVKVSLARLDKKNYKGNIIPFWFTSDHSIDLSFKKRSSAKVILEELTERSYLEMMCARKLGLIELEKPNI